MNEPAKTHLEWIDERFTLKQRIRELEQSESELKQMEAELRESEEKYRNILENIEDGYFEVDRAGDFTYFNTSLCRILGYSREEMSVMNYKVLTDAENVKNVFQAFNEIYVTGIPSKGFEWEAIRKDGAKRCVEVSVSLIVKPGEKPTRFRGIARDITDRKQAEGKLLESEEKYRNILESIEDGYFEVDISGNFTFFNNSVCRILENTRAELMGMNNRKYTDKENSQILYQAFNKVFRTEEPSTGVDYEIIRKDGTKLYIQSSVSLIRNTSGHPIGFRGIMRNITERKQAQEALQASAERYRRIVETSSEGIWILNEEGRTTFVNKRIADMLGDAPEEMLGKRVNSFMFEEDLEDHELRTDLRRRGLEEVFERRFRRKDGTTIWNIVSSSPLLDSQGRFTGSFAMFTDITERKRAEEKLQDTLDSLRKSMSTTIRV